MVYAAQNQWTDHAFDDLLWAIANEQAPRTLWMSVSTGAVFAPYDGGADLFLPTAQQVDDLRAKHRHWLSSPPMEL
jgi:hypothetical protein